MVVSPPHITMQPTNRTLAPGGTAIFSVTAEGNLPLFYHWRKDGTNLNDGVNTSGTATSTLTLSGVTEANNGSYTVTVSTSLGSVTSTGAMLTVIPVSVPGTRVTTLYSFSGGNDGGNPNGLVQGTNGDIYGTTQLGGAYHDGTIFKVSSNGMVSAP